MPFSRSGSKITKKLLCGLKMSWGFEMFRGLHIKLVHVDLQNPVRLKNNFLFNKTQLRTFSDTRFKPAALSPAGLSLSWNVTGRLHEILIIVQRYCWLKDEIYFRFRRAPAKSWNFKNTQNFWRNKKFCRQPARAGAWVTKISLNHL